MTRGTRAYVPKRSNSVICEERFVACCVRSMSVGVDGRASEPGALGFPNDTSMTSAADSG